MTNKNTMLRDKHGRGKSPFKAMHCKKCDKAGRPFLVSILQDNSARFELIINEDGEHKVFTNPPAVMGPGPKRKKKPLKLYRPKGVEIEVAYVCRFCQAPIVTKGAEIVFVEDRPDE